MVEGVDREQALEHNLTAFVFVFVLVILDAVVLRRVPKEIGRRCCDAVVSADLYLR